MKDLLSVLPAHDPLVMLEVTGNIIYQALENSVSAYPILEGRFLQVSGISFAFDPSKPPNSRVEKNLVQIADEWLNLTQTYTLCIKSYLHGGCDGFSMFKDCKIIVSDIRKYFKCVYTHTRKQRHTILYIKKNIIYL